MVESRVTILTATFNREQLLKRLYKSILNQSFKNIEWLIIDDGSTDETEKLILEFIQEELLEIRYFKQTNQGKHVALNYGFDQNKNRLLIIIDSDDEFTPNGLETLVNCWQEQVDKQKIAAIIGNDIDRDGKIIGKSANNKILKCTYKEFVQKYRINGDKAFLWNFEILKRYRFPVFYEEKFISEISLWEKFSSYLIVYVNFNVFKVEYLPTGLSTNSLRLRVNNIKGTLYCYSNSLRNSDTFFFRNKNLINLIRFSIHNNESFTDIVKNNPFKLSSVILYGLSYFLYLMDKRQLR